MFNLGGCLYERKAQIEQSRLNVRYAIAQEPFLEYLFSSNKVINIIITSAQSAVLKSPDFAGIP